MFVAADGQTPAVDGRLTARNGAVGVTSFGSVSADGSFAIDLRPGAWELELMAGNAGLRRLEVQGRSGELRKLGVIVAPASAWTSGYVMSDAYMPVSGASVSYLRPSEYGPIISLRFGNVAKVSTNEEGYFELYGLELGASHLRVEADGFAPLRFTVEAEAVGWVDAGTLELSRGRQVTVRSDVDRGRVVLDPGLKGMPQEFIEGMLTGGEAVIEAVPNRPFSVVVHEQGDPVCEKDMEEGKGDVVVRCDGYAMRVHGRVTMGGRPAEGALWWSEERRVSGGPGSPGTGPAEEQSLARAPRGFELSLDSEGRYRRAGVLPGRWEVFWVSPTGGFGEARKVTVPKGPGDEVTIDFEYGGVSIEGVVLDSEWRPAPRGHRRHLPGPPDGSDRSRGEVRSRPTGTGCIPSAGAVPEPAFSLCRCGTARLRRSRDGPTRAGGGSPGSRTDDSRSGWRRWLLLRGRPAPRCHGSRGSTVVRLR